MYNPGQWKTGPFSLDQDLVTELAKKLDTQESAIAASINVANSGESIWWTITNDGYRSEPDNGYVVANFYMASLFGQCGVAVMSGLTIGQRYRRKGIGKLLSLYGQDLARTMGYSLLFCTDIATYIPTEKVRAATGWTPVYKFVNSRSRNTVGLYVVDLIPNKYAPSKETATTKL